MVIKKIFEAEFDDEVHSDFLKFSRGEFKDKYLLNAKKQANKWAIKAGAELANNLVKSCLQKVSGDVEVSGIIVSTLDLSNEIPFEIKKKSNFQGIRKNDIATTVSPKDVLSLMEKYPRVFFALSFKGENFELKIKPKAPKSGKPGSKAEGEEATADFCTLKTSDENLVSELFFKEGKNWKEISVNHTIIIDGIVYPANATSLKPEELRERAKRKGKIIRKSIIDGNEKIFEAEFIA